MPIVPMGINVNRICSGNTSDSALKKTIATSCVDSSITTIATTTVVSSSSGRVGAIILWTIKKKRCQFSVEKVEQRNKETNNLLSRGTALAINTSAET